jgi:hypothetical protein
MTHVADETSSLSYGGFWNTTSGRSDANISTESPAILNTNAGQHQQRIPEEIQQFRKWCFDRLKTTSLDVETFLSFLLELESGKDINDYIVDCLEEEKSVIDPQKFAEQFLQMRVKLKTLKPLKAIVPTEEYRKVVAKKKKPSIKPVITNT